MIFAGSTQAQHTRCSRKALGMSKAKQYKQKYRKEWETYPEFKGWLKPHVGNDTRAYCMYCKSDFWAKMSDIKKHVATQKHTQKAKPYNSATQSTLPVIHQKLDKARKAEATIAMAVVEHCSMLACDHIGQACKVAFADSTAATNFHISAQK